MSAPVKSSQEAALDLDARWALHPQVALRPESFGALLYHFGTRKLSFLKNRTIVTIIESLPDHSDLRSAIMAAGIAESALPQYTRALATLVGSHMLVRIDA
ncbi:mycofactocin biosynthesis chaperone MftB [Rhodococcus sp. H36-A4]|uniref:mycofactocin biosynthesis chaperone MftB n=1 Tax=Rhodococcus sp. H36-A4 TaxID=3004353 RepID=UPI0022AF297B|nr:mycofactocin biosynthesis chaperone MftB [Rhodococcus sp. H36-A4]MCZ4076338.1 mycofactocin biosynthesis chaperone MftB [Rhodococcus sp. H36-A4]